MNYKFYDQFINRHIGISPIELDAMLKTIGVASLDELIDKTIPPSIRSQSELKVPDAMSEYEYLEELKEVAALNRINKNYIGMGYYETITPSVIARNIFQNPGWYTQYTPYQAEIAQGRLEALLNFQTMVSDLTAMPVANASLLDEGTAAAEAMSMFFNQKNKRVKDKKDLAYEFFVSDQVFQQTIEVILTRAEPLGIRVVVGDWKTYEINDTTFGVLLQYPDRIGRINNYSDFVSVAKSKDVYVTVAADILSLTLLTPPGEWGADAVVGNTQRFGVPLGFGGPHAAYFATLEKYKRVIPGRIIGVSVDTQGSPALRMALQTREQHIRREKATSNICTAQALLAIMAGMYAAYHGPDGIKAIAERIHGLTKVLSASLAAIGCKVHNEVYFDTIAVELEREEKRKVKRNAETRGMNFYFRENFAVLISLGETTTLKDVEKIVAFFASMMEVDNPGLVENNKTIIPTELQRQSEYLTHPVFNSYHTETKMMRYIKRLENKDLSLTHSMIPLGSCTMKLNAATELIPVSWPAFANVHPFGPNAHTKGYMKIINELSEWLADITGFKACSLQPNSGAQGEYAGLMTIRTYHEANGETHRNIALIPSSAHGTNPASAVMAGMKVVVVACDDDGNIDVADLKAKAEQHSDNLSCLMITYPSTHGVFETSIKEVCAIIHKHGGKVYMDGANMNAQVGLTSPGIIGADVCHLNLHKTFSIPHGGGGPGMGPICVNESLEPFLPNHYIHVIGGRYKMDSVSSAPYGSASILLISYAYIKLLGKKGITDATKYAILNANYIKARLEDAYQVLYTGEHGNVGHELILDLRPFKDIVSAEDVAKRLIDYGFHAPTLSFPVAGTIMIEPTESESQDELDRFCDAMLQIREEIDEIARGDADATQNVLANAPHTAALVTSDDWNLPYGREKAAYPLPYLREGFKFWPAVGRVNNAHGDRNLVCTCPPMEAYME